MKKRFIFDLDYTLLESDFSYENDYFRSVLSKEDAEIFIPQKGDLLEEYEQKYIRYNEIILSKFLTKKTSVNITPNIIKGWNEYNENMPDTVIDGTYEVLEYLKSKNKELVVLSNWFSKTQSGRLKNSGLDIYFDHIYGGETIIKSDKNAFLNACGRVDERHCVMIGDNYYKDILGAQQAGIDAIHFDRKDENKHTNSIKCLRKIKELY